MASGAPASPATTEGVLPTPPVLAQVSAPAEFASPAPVGIGNIRPRPTNQEGGAAALDEGSSGRPWLASGYAEDGSDYPFDKSTAENYAEKEEVAFSGPYAHVRSTRDYSYHVHYSIGRQWMQDQIIADALNVTARYLPAPVEKKKLRPAAALGRRPWIVFMAGGMGTGKSFVLTWAHKRNFFDLSRYVHVDQDKIKFLLPEMAEYVRRNKQTAGSHTHHESGFVAEIIQEQALLDGKNIVVDGSLRDWCWYKSVFQLLRRNHSWYKIAVVKVTCERDTMLERARVRGEATGRVVPEELLLKSLEQVEESVQQLAPFADWMMAVNNQSVPTISAAAAVNEPRDDQGRGTLTPLDFGWDEFRAVWKRQMGENFGDAEVQKALQSCGAHDEAEPCPDGEGEVEGERSIQDAQVAAGTADTAAFVVGNAGL